MLLVPRLALALLLPLIFVLPHGAKAAPSLADALKEADAKYLGAPDVGGEDAAPKIETGGGDEDTPPATQEISQGAVKAVLSYAEEKGEDGEITRAPMVTVFADGKELMKLVGEGGFADPPVSVQIAEIDPGNPHPEVVVSFYTGGAHCCSDTTVATSSQDGSTWKTVNIGQFDGGPLLATDLDGTAATSSKPATTPSSTPSPAMPARRPRSKCLPSRTARQERHHRCSVSSRRMRPGSKTMIENVPDEDVNGFLAGYVGEKILLGDGKQAWELMLAHYDKESDWGLDDLRSAPQRGRGSARARRSC